MSCTPPFDTAPSGAPVASAHCWTGVGAGVLEETGEGRAAAEEGDVEAPTRALVVGCLRPLKIGGVRHSTLTLLAVALGSGVLTVAYVIKLAGIALGCVVLLVAALLAYASVNTLMLMCMVSGKKTYAAIFSHCVGPRGGPVLDATLFVHGMGACTGYLMFIGDFVPAIIDVFGSRVASWDYELERDVAIVGAAFLTVLLGLSKDTFFLRYALLVSSGALVYMVVVVSVNCPYQFQERMCSDEDGLSRSVSFFNVDMNLFEAFAMCVYAFNCHINVVPVAAGMLSLSAVTIHKVSYRVIALGFMFCCLIGVTGYLSFLSATRPNILLGYDASNRFVAGGRIMLTFRMLVAGSLILHPTCLSALQVVDYFRGRETPTTRPFVPQVATAVICVAIQATIAILVPDVGDVQSLLGGSASSAIMFVIPAYCMRIILPRTRKHRIVEASLWLFGMVGFSSVPIKLFRLAGAMPQ